VADVDNNDPSGGHLIVKNAAAYRSQVCPACVNLGSSGSGIDVTDSLVCNELGWDVCGNPEAVDRMMLAYLTARSSDAKPAAEGVPPDAEILIAYMADDLGWTEHGTGIEGAWLTEAGREALTNLRGVAMRAASGLN
jgi:hypothetical protein